MAKSFVPRQKVSVSAKLGKSKPIIIAEHEWLTIQTNLKHKISPEARQYILKVMNIYASSWGRSAASAASLATLKTEIAAWQKRTAELRNFVWIDQKEKAPGKIGARSKTGTGDRNVDEKLNRIIAFYFGRNLSQIEAEYPLALFARLLDGIIAVSKLTKLKIAPTRETHLWFLWAALILALLEKDGIPVRNPKRKNEILKAPVTVLEKLQTKLPDQRRTESSLRKGAFRAFKIAGFASIDVIETYLVHWSKGNVATRPAPRTPTILMLGFLERLDEQVMLATKSRRRET